LPLIGNAQLAERSENVAFSAADRPDISSALNFIFDLTLASDCFITGPVRVPPAIFFAPERLSRAAQNCSYTSPTHR
jgi:hypothetical protein